MLELSWTTHFLVGVCFSDKRYRDRRSGEWERVITEHSTISEAYAYGTWVASDPPPQFRAAYYVDIGNVNRIFRLTRAEHANLQDAELKRMALIEGPAMLEWHRRYRGTAVRKLLPENVYVFDTVEELAKFFIAGHSQLTAAREAKRDARRAARDAERLATKRRQFLSEIEVALAELPELSSAMAGRVIARLAEHPGLVL